MTYGQANQIIIDTIKKSFPKEKVYITFEEGYYCVYIKHKKVYHSPEYQHVILNLKKGMLEPNNLIRYLFVYE